MGESMFVLASLLLYVGGPVLAFLIIALAVKTGIIWAVRALGLEDRLK